MGTIIKNYNDYNAWNFTDLGDSTSLGVLFLINQGRSGSDSIWGFGQSASGSFTERFYYDLGTWETLGVPVGDVVTAVQLTGWTRKNSNTSYSICKSTWYITDTSLNPIHAGSLIVANDTSASYTQRDSGVVQVNSSYQASSTHVHLYAYAEQTTATTSQRRQQLDDFALTITHNTPSSGIPKHLDYYMKARKR